MATLLGRTVQDTVGGKAATNSRRPDLHAQLGHRGSRPKFSQAPYQRSVSRTGKLRCPTRARPRPGASSVSPSPPKYDRCPRSPLSCLPQPYLTRSASFWGTAGMARLVGLPAVGALPNTISAPDGPPTRGTVEIAHPRRSRPASPRAWPQARPSGALQVWTRVGEGPQRRRTPNTISAPDGPPTRGIGGIAPACCSRLPGCAAGPRCVLMGHCGQGRTDEGPPPARPLNTISAPDGPIDPGH